MIQDDPEHRLRLPARNDEPAMLQDINLGMTVKLGLDGIEKHGAKLERAELDGAILKAAVLTGAELAGASLRGADLVDAHLEEAYLEGADLRGADLRWAVLDDCYLRKARFDGSQLDRCGLRNVKASGASFEGADFGSADLDGAELFQANLSNAKLAGTSLRGANLRDARLAGIDLSTCDMRNTLLVGAQLDRTIVTREQLGDKIGDELLAEQQARSHDWRAHWCLRAKRAYLALKQNFDDLGDYEAASWAYRKERRMEKKEALYRSLACIDHASIARRHYERIDDPLASPWAYRDFHHTHAFGEAREQIPRAELVGRQYAHAVAHCGRFALDQFVEYLCDYGESVRRVLATLVLIFTLFTLAYGRFGGVSHEGRPLPLRGVADLLGNFAELALFSLGAMTTMEVPGMQASASWVEFATRIEVLVSIAVTGLLGFVLGNRIRRS